MFVTTEFQENQETLTDDLEILSAQEDQVLSETPVQTHLGSDAIDDYVQDPVAMESDWQEEIRLDWDQEIQPASVSLAEEEIEEDEEPSVVIQGKFTSTIPT